MATLKGRINYPLLEDFFGPFPDGMTIDLFFALKWMLDEYYEHYDVLAEELEE
jgi:hypothetical protein